MSVESTTQGMAGPLGIAGPFGMAFAGMAGPFGMALAGMAGPFGIAFAGMAGPFGIALAGMAGPFGIALTGMAGPFGIALAATAAEPLPMTTAKTTLAASDLARMRIGVAPCSGGTVTEMMKALPGPAVYTNEEKPIHNCRISPPVQPKRRTM